MRATGLRHGLTSGYMTSYVACNSQGVSCAPAGRHAAVARVPIARGGGADGLAVHAGQVQAGRQAIQFPLQRLQQVSINIKHLRISKFRTKGNGFKQLPHIQQNADALSIFRFNLPNRSPPMFLAPLVIA